MFRSLLVHYQVLYELLYKTITEQYFDLLHIRKTWCDSSVKTESVIVEQNFYTVNRSSS